jgi:hypothetical protein
VSLPRRPSIEQEISMSDDAAAKAAELAELDRQIAIRRASLETGVPVSVLSHATTEDEARALAEEALVWRGGNAPAAPTAPAPAYLPNQVTRESLPYMTPQEISAAHRRGQLQGIGAAPPAPRKTGERNGHNR